MLVFSKSLDADLITPYEEEVYLQVIGHFYSTHEDFLIYPGTFIGVAVGEGDVDLLWGAVSFEHFFEDYQFVWIAIVHVQIRIMKKFQLVVGEVKV